MNSVNRGKRGILSLSLIILAFIASDAVAGKNFYINPVLDASVAYNSNYYYDSINERSAYTWLLQPGVSLGYITPQTKFKIDATLDGNLYDLEDAKQEVETGAKAELEDFIGYTFEGLLDRTTVSKNLSFGIKDKLSFTRDPELLGELENSTSRELYTINTLNPYLDYEFTRFRTGINFENKIIRYDENYMEDSTLNKASIQALYKMNRTYEFGPRFEVEAMDYDQDSINYDGMKLLGVLTRNGKFVNIEGGIGYHKREFDNQQNTEVDKVPWYFSVLSQDSGFSKTLFTLSLLSGMNEIVSYGAGYFSALQVNGRLDRQVLAHLVIGVNASYEWDDYEFSDRDDDILRFGATADYTLTNWLELGVTLGYQQLDSTLDDEDYENTSVMFKLSYIP